MDPAPSEKTYTADELATASGTPRRTIRYYIQLGLIDRPIGETRAAHYTWKHLGQLLRIRELADNGYSLERIAEVLKAGEGAPPPAPPPGSLAVRTHLALAPGLELVIDPGIAALTYEQLRAFARECLSPLSLAQQAPPQPCTPLPAALPRPATTPTSPRRT